MSGDGLNRAEWITLRALATGDKRGSRSYGEGTVLGGPAMALVWRGLASCVPGVTVACRYGRTYSITRGGRQVLASADSGEGQA